jgi:hypothetical protein
LRSASALPASNAATANRSDAPQAAAEAAGSAEALRNFDVLYAGPIAVNKALLVDILFTLIVLLALTLGLSRALAARRLRLQYLAQAEGDSPARD